MKKWLLCLCAALALCVLCAPAMAADDGWEKAYQDLIYEVSSSREFQAMPVQIRDQYGLYDLDGDGIPELFIGTSQGRTMYTYSGGRVVQVGFTTAECVIPEINAIWSSGGNTYIAAGVHFTLESVYKDGKLIPDEQEVSKYFSYHWWDENAVPDYDPAHFGTSVVYMRDDGIEPLYDPDLVKYFRRGKPATKDTYIEEPPAGSQTIEFYSIPSTQYRPSELVTKVTPRVETKQAYPSQHNFALNGRSVTMEAYVIDGNNYCKLRDLAALLNGTAGKFAVNWFGSENTIELITGSGYSGTTGQRAAAMKTARSTTSRMLIDGTYRLVGGYNVDGNNYFKLRDLQKYLDFDLDWKESTSTVVLSAGSTPARLGTLEAYRKFLEDGEHTFSIDGELVPVVPERFALVEMDGDSDPELLVGGENPLMADSLANMAYWLLDYRDGRMVVLMSAILQDIEYMTINYMPALRALGTCCYDQGDYTRLTYKYYENGTVRTETYTKIPTDITSEVFRYYHNDTQITEDEFEANEFSNRGGSFVEFTPNTAANRAAVLD